MWLIQTFSRIAGRRVAERRGAGAEQRSEPGVAIDRRHQHAPAPRGGAERQRGRHGGFPGSALAGHDHEASGEERPGGKAQEVSDRAASRPVSSVPAAAPKGSSRENRSVVVTCERCKTQFQLDSSRVAESGVLVRCSRCRHAFVVKPPDPGPAPSAASDADSAEGFDWEFDNDDLSVAQAAAADARPTQGQERAPLAAEKSEAVDSLLDLDAGAPADPAPGPLDAEFEEEFQEDLRDQQLEEAVDELRGPPADEPSAASIDLSSSASFDEPISAAADEPGSAASDVPASAPAVGPRNTRDELGSPGDWDIFDAPGPLGRPGTRRRPLGARGRCAVAAQCGVRREPRRGLCAVARSRRGRRRLARHRRAVRVCALVAAWLRRPWRRARRRRCPASLSWTCAVAGSRTQCSATSTWCRDGCGMRARSRCVLSGLELVLRDAESKPVAEPLPLGAPRALGAVARGHARRSRARLPGPARGLPGCRRRGAPSRSSRGRCLGRRRASRSGPARRPTRRVGRRAASRRRAKAGPCTG